MSYEQRDYGGGGGRGDGGFDSGGLQGGFGRGRGKRKSVPRPDVPVFHGTGWLFDEADWLWMNKSSSVLEF